VKYLKTLQRIIGRHVLFYPIALKLLLPLVEDAYRMSFETLQKLNPRVILPTKYKKLSIEEPFLHKLLMTLTQFGISAILPLIL